MSVSTRREIAAMSRSGATSGRCGEGHIALPRDEPRRPAGGRDRVRSLRSCGTRERVANARGHTLERTGAVHCAHHGLAALRGAEAPRDAEAFEGSIRGTDLYG